LFLHEDLEKRVHQIDVIGVLLLATGIGGIIYGADQWKSLTMTQDAIWEGIGTAALILLYYHERRTSEPIIPQFLWDSGAIVASSLGAFAVGMVIMSVVAFLPTYIQAAMGRSSASAGIVLGILIVVWTFSSVSAGRLMVHISYRVTAVFGGIVIAAGGMALLSLSPMSTILHAIGAVAIVGIGLGFCNTTWIVLVQTSVSFNQRGTATSAVLFMRFLGQALGAAVSGVFLSFALRYTAPGSEDPLGQSLNTHVSDTANVAERLNLAFSVSAAFRPVFALSVVMGGVAIFLGLRLPRGMSASSPKATSERT
jgi:MFS family permease